MREIKFKPIGFFRMDDDSPFLDWSGYSRTATLTGPYVKGLPLSAPPKYSVAVDASSSVSYTVPKVSDASTEAFTIGAVFYPLGATINQPILSRSVANREGLYIINNKVYFTTLHAATDQRSEAVFEFEEIEKLDVFGVHTPNANRLFVNGEMVAEVSLSDEQIAQGYLAGTFGTTYTSGGQAGTGMLVNNISFFNRSLAPDQIAEIYKYNNKRSVPSPTKPYNGEDVTFGRGIRPHYLEKNWDTPAEWKMGVFDGCGIEGDILQAQIVDDVTIDGQWTDSVYLADGDQVAKAIDSINLDWSGENVVVQVSVDEDNWYPVVKGRNISIIPTGFVPTDQQLYVRAVFSAGHADAFLNNLRVDGYLTGTITPVSGRVRTFTKVVNRSENVPALMSDNWGANIATGGSVVIGPDTDGAPLQWKTLEVWFKASETLTFTNSSGATPSVRYANGAVDSTTKLNQWAVYHFVYTTAANPTITFDSDGILGKITYFPTALTPEEIGRIVANYTGTYTVYVGEIGSAALSEPVDSVHIVDHDWLELSAT